MSWIDLYLIRWGSYDTFQIGMEFVVFVINH